MCQEEKGEIMIKTNKSLCRYMYKTEITNKGREQAARNCKAFGYLDGYFDENIYLDNFEYTDYNNANYEKGYNEGTKERLRINTSDLQIQKTEFIIKLAQFDGQNNIDLRKISNPFREIYLKNYYKSKLTRENIDKYIFASGSLSTDDKEEPYILGYLDGLFNEMTYTGITKTDEENYLYELGFVEGELNSEVNLDKIKLEKLRWIIKLADHDSENGILDRLFTKDALEIYKSHYNYFSEEPLKVSIDPERQYNGLASESRILYDEGFSLEEYLRCKHKKHQKTL